MAGRIIETSCCADKVCRSPRLTNVSPANGGAANPGTTIVFTFNEAIFLVQATWVEVDQFCKSNGTTVPFTSSVSADGKTVTIRVSGSVALDCIQVLVSVLVRNACGKARWFSTCYTAGSCA